MNDNVEHSPNNSKRSSKLPHIFSPHTYERFQQSIRENNTVYTTLKVQDYLNERNIFDIFHFLLRHVIVHQPTNPVRYLYHLLDDITLFRAGLKDPPLFWTKRHIDAIFENVPSQGSELLSLDDYKTAMETLGLRPYDCYSTQPVPRYVDRQTFCTEALNNMRKELTRITNEITR